MARSRGGFEAMAEPTVQVERTAGVRIYRPHASPKPKAGIDWNALTPACSSCGTKSGRLNRNDLCPTCAPTPDVPAPLPSAPKPPRRTVPRQRRTPKPPGRKRVPLDLESIIEAYTGGQTVPSIAQALAVARARVHATLVEAGIELRDDRSRGGNKGWHFDRTGMPGGGSKPNERNPVDEAAVVVDYNLGCTPPQYGVGAKRIRAILDRHKVQRRDDRTGHSGRHQQPRTDEHTRAEVARLYVDERFSRAQVAQRLGIPYKSVVRIMERDGIKARQGQSGHGDGAAALKEQIRRLGVPAHQIKAWAFGEGLVERISHALPTQVVVDAYEAAHDTDQKVGSSNLSGRAT